MERLTERDENGFVISGIETNTENGNYDIWDCDWLEKCLDRLAAYEDTGLEPEEIKEAYQKGWQKAIDEIAYEEQAGTILVENPLLAEYIKLGPIDRLRELAQAYREGLCGIPPVKLHQKIFRVLNGKFYEEIVCSATWEPFTPRPRWKVWVMGSGLPYYWGDVFGKTVFLTREEAERTLEDV